MADYRLEQSGDQLQEILNNAVKQQDFNALSEVVGQNSNDIDAIEAKIPSGASSENKLATEEYVNESVATNSATFRGTYNLVSDLHLAVDASHETIATMLGTSISTADNNDYCFVQVPVSAETPAVIAKIERYKFNGTTWAFEYELNNSGFTAAQWDAINSGITSTDVAKISALDAAVSTILAMIPTGASALNQLATEGFVNSSVATATATFRGTYNLVTDLSLAVDATHAQIGAALLAAVQTADNNDYAFVQVPTSATTPTEIKVTERYKFNGTAWEYEYDLNNSGFTAAQWAALNSGITVLLVTKLSGLPDNDALTAMFTAITQVIPSAASSSNKLVDYAQMAAALALKQDNLTFDDVPTLGSNNPVKSNGIKTAIDAVAGDVTTLTGRVSTNEADIALLQDAYEALTQSTPEIIQPSDTWPVATPEEGVIYRVIDRVNTPPQYYSDYMWNGTAMVQMAQYNNAIDPVPTAGSHNLVESGGVFSSESAIMGFAKTSPTGFLRQVSNGKIRAAVDTWFEDMTNCTLEVCFKNKVVASNEIILSWEDSVNSKSCYMIFAPTDITFNYGGEARVIVKSLYEYYDIIRIAIKKVGNVCKFYINGSYLVGYDLTITTFVRDSDIFIGSYTNYLATSLNDYYYVSLTNENGDVLELINASTDFVEFTAERHNLEYIEKEIEKVGGEASKNYNNNQSLFAAPLGFIRRIEGAGEKAKVSASSWMEDYTNCSIELCFKNAGFTQTAFALSWLIDEANEKSMLFMIGDGYIGITAQGFFDFTYSSVASLGETVIITLTKKGSTYTMYVNGQYVNSATANITTRESDIYLGSYINYLAGYLTDYYYCKLTNNDTGDVVELINVGSEFSELTSERHCLGRKFSSASGSGSDITDGDVILSGEYTLDSEITLSENTHIRGNECVIHVAANGKLNLTNGCSIEGVVFDGGSTVSRTQQSGTGYYALVPLISISDIPNYATYIGSEVVSILGENATIENCRFDNIDRLCVKYDDNYMAYTVKTQPNILNNYFYNCRCGIYMKGEFCRIIGNMFNSVVYGTILLGGNLTMSSCIYMRCDVGQLIDGVSNPGHSVFNGITFQHNGIAGTYILQLPRDLGNNYSGCHWADAPIIGVDCNSLLVTGSRLDSWVEIASGNANAFIANNIYKSYAIRDNKPIFGGSVTYNLKVNNAAGSNVLDSEINN